MLGNLSTPADNYVKYRCNARFTRIFVVLNRKLLSLKIVFRYNNTLSHHLDIREFDYFINQIFAIAILR